jgi:tripartite-type tricarboxylate transporter receptor subunit TctC
LTVPEEAQARPAGHGRQAEARLVPPVAFANVPGGHGTVAVVPFTQYEPAGHNLPTTLSVGVGMVDLPMQK